MRNGNLFTRQANLDAKSIQDSGAPERRAYDDVWATGVNRRIADLRFGGQMGYAPDFTTYVNFTPYVSRNVVAVLMEAPLAMRALPHAERWIGALRAMVETMPMSISGLKYQLEVSTGQVNFGGAGQEFEVFTNVKESKPDIEFVYTERTGMAVHRYLSAWIRYLMMDPNSKFATINTIAGSTINDLMADQYSMTVLFYEPDELNRFVNQAWLVTNMFPKGTGANDAKRDMAADGSTRELSIPFSGLAQCTVGVNDLAQSIMSSRRIQGADPAAASSFISNISAYIKGLEEDAAYGESYKLSQEQLIERNRILKPGFSLNSKTPSATGSTPDVRDNPGATGVTV